jgi:uncharacterized membrane protein (UPF0136 family)
VVFYRCWSCSSSSLLPLSAALSIDKGINLLQTSVESMTGSSHAALGVGGIVIAGGAYAFFKRRSAPSLIGSCLIGGCMIAGGYLINNGSELNGHTLAATASVGLVGVGLSRYIKTSATMPAAPMCVLGILSAAYQIKKTMEWA